MGNKKNTHTILYPIVRSVLSVIFYKGFKLHVEGQENIPATGAIIAAPNHKSDWDPPLVGIAFPNRVIHYMAKEELFKNPVFAWILRLFGTFPVKRGAIDTSAIMRAVRELKQGNILGIFPEGTRIRKDGRSGYSADCRPEFQRTSTYHGTSGGPYRPANPCKETEAGQGLH